VPYTTGPHQGREEGSVADKQAITELFNRSGVAYDDGDVAFLADTFVDDGVFRMTIAGGDPIVFEGKETIRKLYEDSLAGQDDQRRHVITNVYFTEEASDTATAVSYLTLLQIKDGVLTTLSSGKYTDKVVRRGTDWKYTERFLELDLGY
jgi:hypothetical protein